MVAQLTPKISIGMPIYNGGIKLQYFIDEILSQSFKDFELIISDNCSSDGTDLVCQQFARRDKRIKYFRQSKNLGAIYNFTFVLEQSSAEYFMWAAADDRRSLNFLEENLNFLESNPDFVASTSPTHFNGQPDNAISMGDKSLEENIRGERIQNFFCGWHANARFYSLIRTDVLMNFPFKSRNYLGFDWAWIIYLASQGKLKRINLGWVELGVGGESNSKNIFKSHEKRIIHWFIPFYDLSRDASFFLKGESLGNRISVFFSLVRLNLAAIKLRIMYFVTATNIYKYYKRYKT